TAPATATAAAAAAAGVPEGSCRPFAEIDGADDELVREVSGVLASSGVGLVGPGDDGDRRGCPLLRAHLARGADTVWVYAVDGAGRVLCRNVASTETAAVLIESWATAESDGAVPDTSD